MSRTYTKREIASLLNCSVRTVEEDADWFGLDPEVGDRGMNLYSSKDFELISQMRSHCADKSKTRSSFVPSTQAEIVEDEPKVTKLQHSLNAFRVESGAHSALVKSNLATYKYPASVELGLSQDPLFDLELLQRISDARWLLPSARLAPLLGITSAHLNTKQQYNYCGFVITRAKKINNKTLWKVEATPSY